MPRQKPIEGVHYMRDRYAFLNAVMEDGEHEERISSESTPDEIERVIKLARSLNHPDRQAKAGKKRRLEAEEETKYIAECERYLLNPEIKALYDQKLAEFQRDHPGRVVIDQTPVFGPFSSYFDVNSLLSEEEPDRPEIETYLLAMSHYDEEKLRAARSLFETMPDNPQVRDLYRDALSAKLLYLDEKERQGWGKIGWQQVPDEYRTHAPVMDFDDYVAAVEQALEAVAERDVRPTLEQRGTAARIGMTAMPRLLTAGEPAQDETPDQTLMDPSAMEGLIVKLNEQALANFEIRSERVLSVAEQKQEVLSALIPLTKTKNLNAHNPLNPHYRLYLVLKNENLLIEFALDVSTGKAKQLDLPEGIKTLDDLKRALLEEAISLNDPPLLVNEFNVLVIEHNDSMSLHDALMQVTYVANDLLEKMHKLFETRPNATPADKIEDGP